MSKKLFSATFLLTFRTSFGSFLDHFALNSQITSFRKKIDTTSCYYQDFSSCLYLKKVIKLLHSSITKGPFVYYFLGSIAPQHLLVSNLCVGIKENLASPCLTALMLEEELN